MKKIYILLLPILTLLAACTAEPMDPVQESVNQEFVFTALLCDSNAADTKIYLDGNTKLHWNSYGDEISVFTPGLHAPYYVETISGTNNSVRFAKADTLNVSSTRNLNYNVGVYPYSQNNAIDNDGNVHLTVNSNQWGYFNINSERSYLYDYPMVAVTGNLEDHVLPFYGTCGILLIPIKGTGVVKSVKLASNGGEAISGPATVDISNPKAPALKMDSGAGSEITVDISMQLQANAVNQVAFVLPPVTLANGFTVEITDIANNVVTKTTQNSCTIQRGVINSMAEINVDLARVAPFKDEAEMEEFWVRTLDYLWTPGRFYDTPDEWGFVVELFKRDVLGADLCIPESGYNWFSAVAEYNMRGNYRATYISYVIIQGLLKDILDLETASKNLNGETAKYIRAQAKAFRAYLYQIWAQLYQFSVQVAPNAPCVPIISTYEQYDSQTRASVKDVYSFMCQDIEEAISALQGYTRPNKTFIDKTVAMGIAARIYLELGEYSKAYEYANSVGFDTPATIEEVSKPYFMDINEHNWIWGCDVHDLGYSYSVSSSWLRSFSNYAYSTGVGVYSCITDLLYDKISATDVRKGWWLDQDLESPNVKDVLWTDGTPFASNVYDLIPYTNVKFGCNEVGGDFNNDDMPLMRVEEMILIQAEARARLGDEASAREILRNFVKTYRDPSYDDTASGRSILDEIWFQRRVELWGEGFFYGDRARFNKPLVRFHDEIFTNVAWLCLFNLPADSKSFLIAFPDNIVSGHPGMEANPAPDAIPHGANQELRDGVTD
ncbi:MAG: RagB/SusD family nutrient uptake outer membrane protein [Bacteroidales bacterium]|nr:RagB/SusD family nutrient uptake outer membrane protein [Bacteroidales bacterium]